MRKKSLRATAMILAAMTMLTACSAPAEKPAETSASGAKTEGSSAAEAKEEGSGEVVNIEFWSAPQVAQQAFWESMAQQYKEVNPNVNVTVSAMPESPSSEAGIQSAIASGTAPAASENVFRGFGAQLAESEAIVPFDSFEGFDEVVTSRGMTGMMESWEFGDGHQYVLPMFSNPSMFLWRIDLLKELGFDAAPKTYSEVYEVGAALKEKYPDKFVWASNAFTNTSWYKRWWDYLTLYIGASEGNAFIENNKLVADDEAAVEVYRFFDEMNKNGYLLAQEVTDPFETGIALCTQFVPFRYKAMHEKYPELGYETEYVVAAAPVPDDVPVENVKTMSDNKGVVIYSQVPEEQQKAAFEFIKWVYEDGTHDGEWMDTTYLLPAQDDLLKNDEFKALFETSPELVPFAENVKNAVPAIDNADYVETHTALGELGMVPVLNGEKTPEEAWADVKAAVEGILQ